MAKRCFFLALAALGLHLCLTPAVRGGEGPPRPAIAPKLQHYVEGQVMAGAVILVADREKVLALEAFGYSDLTARTPMRADNLFWIASISKPVTAAALMMLVDEGKVRLDDPVAKYIPAFAEVKVAQADGTLAPPSQPIRIREILSHTSGLRFLNSKDRQIIDSVPLETSVAHALLEPLLFEPGTKFLYSNEGIDAAGRIIEIVSGMPYEQFLQERLFTPLGMVDTTFRPSAEQLKRLAKSYKAAKDKKGLVEAPIHFLTYPLDGQNRHPAPGGGLFSTARDLCRFAQMLANGGTLDGRRCLSPEAVHEMTIKQTGAALPNQYGLGINGSDGTVFGHTGAFKTKLEVEHGQIRIFLAQQAAEWSSGNPESDFATAARRLFPCQPPCGLAGFRK
ncbi:MAG: serine hydrolase domain-containing protein [Lentisphaeria bacterium]|jgi:CubicO group peptidase (beta-lactamase class C family)